jgi:uncharacterized membrane protein
MPLCHEVEGALFLLLMNVLQCGAVFVSHSKDDVWVVYQQISKMSRLLDSSAVPPVVCVWAI